MRELIFRVPAEFEGARAQSLLRQLGFSRRAVIRLKALSGESGGYGLTRGGELLRTIDVLHEGDEIRAAFPDDEGGAEANPSLKAEVIYEDEDAVVFDKPPYMPVHPSIRHREDTLANLFAAKYPGIAFRPINRLDKNTSGLCLCAKNSFAAAALSGSAEKVYFAVTNGTPDGDTIDVPIGRESGSIIRRRAYPREAPEAADAAGYAADAKPAVTHFSAVEKAGRHTLLRVTLETGRTHQIRVHMAYAGFPLCGDEMYGGDMSEIGRQALHCGELSFTQPVTGTRIHLTSALPDDMRHLLLQKNNQQTSA